LDDTLYSFMTEDEDFEDEDWDKSLINRWR
jgi:hypothetical protein